MSLVAENRTISMILTVPDANEFFSDSVVDQSPVPSIPIYHGSIVQIEPHEDDENISDLTVRVPNFHHLSLPSVTITINDHRSDETDSQREAKIKRRAPICPILNGRINENQATNEEISKHLRLINPKRIAIGLRNLRRTILANTKGKQTRNINEITIIPVVPDVEVISEDIQVPIITKKSQKKSASKFFQPKLLFIKRKHLKISKKRQSSSNSVDTQTDQQTNEITVIEQTNEENQNLPISSTDKSTSNVSQPNIFISNVPIDIQIVDQNVENIEEGICVVNQNEDTYSECYEVTYEFDPDFHPYMHSQEQQIVQPNKPEPQSIQISLDPSDQYEDLASAFSRSLPIVPANNYEQIGTDQKSKSSMSRVNFQLNEDVAPTSAYQSEIISTFPSSSDNIDIVPFNDSPIVDEGYSVLIEFLKHALQIGSNDDNENDFQQQLQELSSTAKI